MTMSFSLRTAFALAVGAIPSTAPAVPINIANAEFTAIDSVSFRLDHIAALGGDYWGKWEWTSAVNKWQLDGFGEINPFVPDMIWIPAGSFVMGTPVGELGREADESQHEVTLTSGCYMSETEVTQAEWVAMMGTNPSEFPGCDCCPVENVNWFDAVDYCNQLSQAQGFSPAYDVDGTTVTWLPNTDGFRLPTEAEWEYACRAGTSTGFYNGEITYEDGCSGTPMDPNLDEIAWFCANTDPWGTKPAAQKEPNAWGLYDMSGNIREWCWDWYAFNYPAGPVTDPTGPQSGTWRVTRGGSFHNMSKECRSGRRTNQYPDLHHYVYGIRVVRSIP